MNEYVSMYNEFLLKFPGYSYDFDTLSVLLVEEGALIEDESAYIQRRLHVPTDKKLYLLKTILPHKDMECQLGFVRVLKKLKQLDVARWWEERITSIRDSADRSATFERAVVQKLGSLHLGAGTSAASRTSQRSDVEPFFILPIWELKSSNEVVGIKNCVRLGSYNNVLVCKDRRDILVVPGVTHQLLAFSRGTREQSTYAGESSPNVPTVWITSHRTFTQVGRSVQYRDPEYNKRSMSINLALLAVLHSNPEMKLDDFDYVIDHQD